MLAKLWVERLQSGPASEESVKNVILGVHFPEPPNSSDDALGRLIKNAGCLLGPLFRIEESSSPHNELVGKEVNKRPFFQASSRIAYQHWK